MKTNLIKELLVILIASVPAIYLAMVWTSLPATVPMHYDLDGNVNRYGNKSELIWLSFGLPFFIYLLFMVIPFIDPKGKIKAMGNKLFQLKVLLVIFMSVLSFYIIYTSLKPQNFNENLVFVIVGLLFSVLGNFFQSLKPNYFIGIRTPWTLENETVWKETHTLAGKIWMVGGLLIVMLTFLMSVRFYMFFFLGITAIMVLWPVIYSYRRFKALKSSVSKD
ncbi:MAG: SdpI family protein [Bacteroidetes bacterium]|nr:SdpI family protein [Bacteroidota bacterium]